MLIIERLLSTIWVTHKISTLDEWSNVDMDQTEINNRDMMMQVVNLLIDCDGSVLDTTNRNS